MSQLFILSSFYSVVSLLTLRRFSSSEEILNTDEEALAGTIAELCNSRSKKWAKEKATQLKEAAIRNPFQKALYHSHILSLHMYSDLLLQYKEHLSKLADEIDALAKEVE